MKMRIMGIVISILLVFAGTAIGAPAEITAEQWSRDLELLRTRVPEVHPDPFRKTSRQTFDDSIDTLIARLPNLEPHEVEVAIGEIMASIGDGHTRLTWSLAGGDDFVQGHSETDPPASSELLLHTLPVRFGLYAEGVFVERIDARWGRLAGASLIRIGRLPTDQAIEALTPVIRHDNELQLLDLLPMHLVIPEILHARGIAQEKDRVSIVLRTEAGAEESIELRPLEDGVEVDWTDAFSQQAGKPLSHQFLRPGRAPAPGAFDRNYWYEWIPENKTIYLQYNEVTDQDGESILDFAQRLRAFIADHPVERLILDLRYNGGGDNSLNRALLHALIASDRIRGPGRLFVLIGRGTFSAAMMFATDLERHLDPVFVGEPTGSSPNHAGDSRKTKLPESGLTLRISTLDWQYSGPRDSRSSIEPHIATPPRWRDMISGRDPALDAILAPGDISNIDGRWEGRMTVQAATYALNLSLSGDTGTLSIPGVADDLPVRIGRDAAGNVVLAVERDDGGFSFVGRPVGPRIVGHAIYSGVKSSPLVFLLERASQ